MPRVLAVFLLLVASLPLFAADLEISLAPPKKLLPSGDARYALTVINRSSTQTRHLTVHLYFDKNIDFAGFGGTEPAVPCVPTHVGTARCHIGELAPESVNQYVVIVRLPPESDVYSSASIFESDQGATLAASDTTTTFYRWFTVMNTADSGPGSLRSTISDVNSQCLEVRVPCGIEFAGDARSFAPLSPLPRILAQDVFVDGDHGIEIDGSRAGVAHGLEIAGDRIRMDRVTITRFNGIGLLLYPVTGGGGMTITRNHITGNGVRGIMTYGMTGTIASNTIASNRLSGIFAATGSFLTISGNHIEGNGNAGIYIGDPVRVVTVENNNIVANRGYGVALGAESSEFVVLANIISNNALGGIDDGLNGRGGGSGFVVAAPSLTRAVYDDAIGKTLITGQSCDPRPTQQCDVLLFVSDSLESDGTAEGDRFLGKASAGGGGTFEFFAEGELRGKFVTAIAVMRHGFLHELERRQTSEFSLPLRVE